MPLLGAGLGTGHRLAAPSVRRPFETPMDRFVWEHLSFAPLARSLICRRGASPPRLQAETEEVLAHHLDVRGRNGGVLGGDMHVTEAALKRVLLKGVRPSEVVDDVHGLRGAHACVDAPEAYRRSLLKRRGRPVLTIDFAFLAPPSPRLRCP